MARSPHCRRKAMRSAREMLERCRTGRDVVQKFIDGQNRIRWIKPEGAFYGFLHLDGLKDSLAFAQRAREERHVSALHPARRSVQPAQDTPTPSFASALRRTRRFCRRPLEAREGARKSVISLRLAVHNINVNVSGDNAASVSQVCRWNRTGAMGWNARMHCGAFFPTSLQRSWRRAY